MGWEQIASGNRDNIYDLPGYESQVAEGQRARIDFKFATGVPVFQIDSLRNTLEFAGVNEVQVTGSGDTIHITYRKDPWWVPVIIIAVLALVILVVSWIFFKEVESKVGPVPVALIIGAGSVLALALSYNIFRRH